ncbi:MAG: tetratricopeptide repeat protein, partial [Acidobacteriota bacterium]
PQVAYVHNNLGLAYENSGCLEEAREQFRKGLALVPGGARLTMNLARVEAVLGPQRQAGNAARDEDAAGSAVERSGES